jgi:hypothetical protein
MASREQAIPYPLPGLLKQRGNQEKLSLSGKILSNMSPSRTGLPNFYLKTLYLPGGPPVSTDKFLLQL